MNSTVSSGRALDGASPVVLSGAIDPIRLSPAYRLGLVVVAIAMVLLPILYVGLITLASVAVWWHLTTNGWILDGRGSLWAIILYLGPAIAGVGLVFFLVKPILARPGKHQDPVELDESAEPALFAFVEQICQQVRAPIPSRVQVDCRVNASAGFKRGPFSLLKRDLVLTIGLPLAAGLSVRELGGVLAHEFGHFAQGGAMRLTAVVRGINGWFARVVYERDEWDDRLEQWSKDVDWRLAAVLWMARGSVWLSRQVLAGLMKAGHAISCFMLRQMEYDADGYEIRFSGSDAFARTSMRMRELNVGAQFGYNDLSQGWQQRKLPSNLPVFLVERSNRLPDDLLSRVRQVPEEATGVFDTHPSDADRVRAAEAAASAGIVVGGDGPATGLFRDFDALSVEVTRHHYQHDLSLDLGDATFVETHHAIREARTREERQDAVRQLFGERFSEYRPLNLIASDLPQHGAAELWAAWRSACSVMTSAGDQLAERYRHFESLVQKQNLAFSALELLTAGVELGTAAAEFGLTEGTAADAISKEAAFAEGQQSVGRGLEGFEQAAARRLLCCVRLSEPSTRTEAEPVIDALNALVTVMPQVLELEKFAVAARVLAQVESATEASAQQVRTRVALQGARINKALVSLHQSLSGASCPDAFTAEPMSLAARCGLTSDGRPDSLSDVLGRVFTLYYGMLGYIAVIALQVEKRTLEEGAG